MSIFYAAEKGDLGEIKRLRADVGKRDWLGKPNHLFICAW